MEKIINPCGFIKQRHVHDTRVPMIADIEGFEGFERASQIAARQQNIPKLTSGHPDLDELLGGGLAQGHLAEIRGNPGAGRTALAHLFAVRAQLPTESGGLGSGCLYVDPRRRFDPDRIVRIIEFLPEQKRQSLAQQVGHPEGEADELANAVLENIIITKPRTGKEQIKIIERVASGDWKLSRGSLPIRLFLFDALSFHIKSEYSDGSSGFEEALKPHIRTIWGLTRVMNSVAVLFTTSNTYPRWKTETQSTYKIHLRQTSGAVRYAEVAQSRRYVDEKTPFYVENGQFTPE